VKFALPLWIGLVLLATGSIPSLAQYVDDEEMDDHRRQDEEYYKRYMQKDEEPPPPAGADDAALAEAFLAKADELIRDKNHRSRSGERYKIQTDDPRVDLQAVETLLESFRDYFDASWADRAPGKSYDGQGRFFLFYSYHKYNQLLGADWSRQWVRPKGHYGSVVDAVVVHTDSDRAGGLPNTLVHESAHQLVDQVVYGGEFRPSLWVAEGLASYYENTFMDAEGQFEDGVIGGKQISAIRGEKARAVSETKTRIRDSRRALDAAAREEEPLLLSVISANDPSEFYGRNTMGNYDLAWLLVHFLLHGDNGSHADSFVRYLQLEAENRGGVEVFLNQIGMTPAELDAAVQRHTKSLKVR
jgi:hypothetical protein